MIKKTFKPEKKYLKYTVNLWIVLYWIWIMKMETKVGLFFICMPISIFLLLMLINMPNAFSHCWFSYNTDMFLGSCAVGSFIIGSLYIIFGQDDV